MTIYSTTIIKVNNPVFNIHLTMEVGLLMKSNSRRSSLYWRPVMVIIIMVLLMESASCSVYNAPCGSNAECTKIYNSEYECMNSHCLRKSFDYSKQEIFGFFMIIVISMITNAGGVGAGTIIIPAYIVFFGFVSSDAIPLSRITIFAGSLVNYIINWKQRDPFDEKRFLINYNLAAVMMPLLLAGTQVGVIFSRFLPAALISMILVVYLISATRQMYQRAKKDTEKEKELEMYIMKGHNDSITSGNRTDESLDNTSNDILDQEKGEEVDRDSGVPSYSTGENSANKSRSSKKKSRMEIERSNQLKKELQEYKMKRDASHSEVEYQVPMKYLIKKQWPNFVTIIFSFVMLVLSSVLRGGEGRSSIIMIESCGGFSWAIFLITQLGAILVSMFAYDSNKFEFMRQDASIKTEEERQERVRIRKKLLMAGFTTGILAGLLGIGGGMVLGLYMLTLGMDVQVSTALSIFVVLFSSGATTFQFIVAGAIHLRHAYFFMILSLIGSLIGNFVLKAILKKYRRPSVLIWILFGVLCIATAVLPLEMALNIKNKSTSAVIFGPFC